MVKPDSIKAALHTENLQEVVMHQPAHADHANDFVAGQLLFYFQHDSDPKAGWTPPTNLEILFGGQRTPCTSRHASAELIRKRTGLNEPGSREVLIQDETIKL